MSHFKKTKLTDQIHLEHEWNVCVCISEWEHGNNSIVKHIHKLSSSKCTNSNGLRATSHKKLRACDHFTSSTLIGGKGGAGPSSLYTTLEGPTKYVNARLWM